MGSQTIHQSLKGEKGKSMYQVEATKEQLTVSLNGECVMTLREGNTLLIGLTGTGG